MSDKPSVFPNINEISVRGLFTAVVSALLIALILALFALFRDVDLMGVAVKANSGDVRELWGRDSEKTADIREIRVRLEAVARIERKLDQMGATE